MIGRGRMLQGGTALVALLCAGLSSPVADPLLTMGYLGVAVCILVFRSVWQAFVILGFAGVVGLRVLTAEAVDTTGVVALGAGLLPVALVWLMAWISVTLIADARPETLWHQRLQRLVVPLIFGATVLWLWQALVVALGVSPVILPQPSAIAAKFASALPVLWGDFVQTFIKGALTGYVMGCAAAFVTALAVDRSPFLQRGLLPVGNFVAALPIVGIAPILVMWFGFDWQSKAAVVVVMVFFPMLVNTVEGLKAADVLQRDLMATYSASYGQSLLKLRLPAAMPFVFNGLKICTTLAMIGAIVAEFFGSPTQGMGFRISTEVGRLGLDMVWAEIAVAALAGSAFYAGVAVMEKGVTFWHPSQRGR